MNQREINQQVIKKLVLGNLGERKRIFKSLQKQAKKKGIFLSSTLELYKERAKQGRQFVIPAFNLRGLTFELALAIFQLAKQKGVKEFIFELARSEISYTKLTPKTYAALVLAAAIHSGWQGPIYLQADHLQVNPSRYNHSLLKETHLVKKLIKDFLKADFFSLDIDCSPLNKKKGENVEEVLAPNLETTSKLLRFLRILERRDKGVAVGIEVGEIGEGKTSEEELKWFLAKLGQKTGDYPNLAKVAVQTGTKHGGEILPSGKLKRMEVDFSLLKCLNDLAKECGLYGVVQHGASTLPLPTLEKLPATGVLEVHLATAFQNLIFDNPHFPKDLKEKIYLWLEEKFGPPKKEKYHSQVQFFYETRKHAWGQFRKEFLDLPTDFKEEIKEKMTRKAAVIFKVLKVCPS